MCIRDRFDKCVKRLAPRYAVILQEKLNKQDAKRKDRKLVPENLFPSLSGETVDGERVDLSSFKGSWILLDVWATWCGPVSYTHLDVYKRQVQYLR